MYFLGKRSVSLHSTMVGLEIFYDADFGAVTNLKGTETTMFFLDN